ncbi:MAG: Ferric uptake regulator, Fur family [Clostridia bacterium 41_269]|nr:MAG: Ferric uptake regulator, Fur family [Clostridia bacterium 41_269]
MNFQKLIKEFKKKGYKLTPQRRLILEILSKEKHISAEEIFERIKQSQPNVSFGTVYRNLNILLELGLINQLDFKDGRTRFELNKSHHHHLICLDCGVAFEIQVCPFNSEIFRAADSQDFSIENHSFEIYGYCRNCKYNKTKKLDGKEEQQS